MKFTKLEKDILTAIASEKTHCYYRCYSKLYKQFKQKEQEQSEGEMKYGMTLKN